MKEQHIYLYLISAAYFNSLIGVQYQVIMLRKFVITTLKDLKLSLNFLAEMGFHIAYTHTT